MTHLSYSVEQARTLIIATLEIYGSGAIVESAHIRIAGILLADLHDYEWSDRLALWECWRCQSRGGSRIGPPKPFGCTKARREQ